MPTASAILSRVLPLSAWSAQGGGNGDRLGRGEVLAAGVLVTLRHQGQLSVFQLLDDADSDALAAELLDGLEPAEPGNQPKVRGCNEGLEEAHRGNAFGQGVDVAQLLAAALPHLDLVERHQKAARGRMP
jgi:hypothetical protein